MTVRLATPRDADMFMTMVEEYLNELRAVGSEILATRRTLTTWRRIFDLYVVEDGPGAVAVADDIGFSAAGSLGEPLFDTTFGVTANGWGTYVRTAHRGNRVANKLRAVVHSALRKKGFETIVGGVHVNNAAGISSADRGGFTPIQVMGHSRLDSAAEET